MKTSLMAKPVNKVYGIPRYHLQCVRLCVILGWE